MKLKFTYALDRIKQSTLNKEKCSTFVFFGSFAARWIFAQQLWRFFGRNTYRYCSRHGCSHH